MEDGSFEAWYRKEHARVIGVLAAVSGDRDLSVEATDEAFTRALARWERVSRMDNPSAWTTKVALNVLRKTMNRRKLERRALERLARPESVPQSDPDLWELARSLPERQRTAVALRYVADYPEAEIARIMGIRRGTVSASLFAARRHLAEMLDADMTEEEVAGA